MRQLKKKGANKLIKVDPSNKYTVCEDLEHQLGKVDNIYIVASSKNPLHEKPLKELAKQRIKARSDPIFTDLKEDTELDNPVGSLKNVMDSFTVTVPWE